MSVLLSLVSATVLLLCCLGNRAASVEIPLTECYQSSTFDDAHCNRAIDGNTNQDYQGRSCTHTNDANGWWVARAKQLTQFRQIRILNRRDCCSHRLNDVSILVDGEECATYRSSEFFLDRTFDCNKIGQVIRVEIHTPHPLTLCEVQAFGEVIDLPSPGTLLPMTNCLQSSTAHQGECKRAIDGNTNQHYGGLSCTHTNVEQSWWQASTERASHITHIRIYNRLDCCLDSLNDFTISVDGHQCVSYLSSGFISTKTFQCNRIGQVVRIESRKSTPLMLCEVQVFGEVISSPSIGNRLGLTQCLQSSTTSNGDCHRAIDGGTNQNYRGGSCSHTDDERSWWRARSHQLSLFRNIRIYNRLDCCPERLNDFVITVDGFVCATFYSTGFFAVETFECNRVGQVLAIVNRRVSPLTLCEVEAYGDVIELPNPGPQLPLTDCSQSSVSHDAPCSRAIDANTNPDWGRGSCIHTNAEQGWWQARTHKISNITHIRIYNRLDCCSEHLNDFSISVDGHDCASYKSGGFISVDTFECNIVGQVIRVRNRKSSNLMFCEVQVFGKEVAQPSLGAQLNMVECSQSSVTHDGVCQRAVDGNTDQNYGGGSCIHTAVERGWWQARSDKLAKVTHIRVFNRLDCCSDSLTDFSVTVDGHECASYRSHRFFSMETIECNQIGQVVRLINRRPTPLMICEVQVFGTPVDMAAPGKQLRLKTCSQTSTTHEAPCEKAIDGIKNQNFGDGSCTHTASEKSWWQARIDKTAFVTHVRIYNRLDCCSDRLSDFTIFVGGHECAWYQSDGFFSVMTFNCNALGEVVRIESHKAVPLTLCEVQVFGLDKPKK